MIGVPIGTRVMLSTPAAMNMSCVRLITPWAAKWNRMLRASALAVDRDGGDAVGKLRRHHNVAADVESLLADLPDAAGNNVLDGGGVDSGALDKRVEDGGPEVCWMPVLQRSVALASGGSDRIDDVSFHAGSLRLFDGCEKVVDGGVELVRLVEIGEVRCARDDLEF